MGQTRVRESRRGCIGVNSLFTKISILPKCDNVSSTALITVSGCDTEERMKNGKEQHFQWQGGKGQTIYGKKLKTRHTKRE